MKRVLLLAPVLLVIGCGHGKPAPRRGYVDRLPRLEVVTPRITGVERKLELAATVEALKRVELNARVPGIVEWLPDVIDIGKPVKKDDVLARLAVPELRAELVQKKALLGQAFEQLKQAREALVVAQREVTETKKDEARFTAEVEFHRLRHTRIQGLVKQRAQDPAVEEEARRQLEVARAALEANRARLSTREARTGAAEADIGVAEARIEVARAEVGRLDELVGFATLLAPFDGVITRRWVDPGATLKGPEVPLLTLMQIDRVRVLIDVPQRDVALLNAREQSPNPDGQGDPVTVRIPSLTEKVKDGEFRGSVTRTARSLDPITRTMRAEVELPNPDDLLRPGMFGSASLMVEKRYDKLTIPASCLVKRGEGRVDVFVVADAQKTGNGQEWRGVLRRVPVELGIDDGKIVEVKGGLKGGELVVLRGNGIQRTDERVLAVPAQEE